METPYPFDPYDWATITPLFHALMDASVEEGGFATWFDQWNQLDLAVNDAWTELKRRSYSATTDAEAEQAYQTFTREMFSTYLDVTNSLATRTLMLQPAPPSPTYAQLWRRWQNQTTLFHPDSVPIQAEISVLESGYRELMRHIEQLPGNATAHWMERRAELNGLMLRLLKLRRELARVCGEPTFLAFRWRELNRLDATIEEYQAFHHTVEELVIPALVQLRENHVSHTAIPQIVDPARLSDHAEHMLGKLDPTFGALFHTMRDGYIDLGTRPGKASTSEQWFFPLAGMPYLHSDATNLGTILHESGHAIHAHLAFQSHPSQWNYYAPDEFQEFIAASMHELCLPYSVQTQGGVYSAAESAAARCESILHDYLETTAWGVMEDAFEQWVYGDAPEDVTPAQFDAKWLELRQRFMPWDVAGKSELEVMTGWQRGNWSLFRMPLYTITYSLDTIATFLLAAQARGDRASVIANYKAAMSLGNTKSLPELFHTVGITFPFSQQAVGDALRFALDEYAAMAAI